MASGTTLAQAYVQVIPSMRGVKGMLSSQMGGEGASAGKTAGMKIAAGLKAAVIAAGIGKAISSSIQEGAKLEQSIGGVETIFGKKDAETVKKNAQNAYKTLQISANTYMEQATSFSASLLQSLDGDTAKAAKAADVAITDMSDNANKMGTNIQDIQNAYQGFAKQNYTMLDNLKLGYGGTKTEMERLLSDASKISGQKYDISNLADVYEAIHVVQQEMGLTGTSAKEAETTLSGSFNAMKAAAQNFMGNLTLGQNVSESMQGLVTTTSTYLFKNLLPAVGRIFQSLPAAMGTFIKQGVPELMTQLTSALTSLGSSMEGSGDIIKNAFKGLLDLSNIVLDNSGDLIKAGMDMLKNLAKGIAQALPTVIETAPKIISNLANVINNNAPTILATGVSIIKTLAVGILKAIPALIVNLPQIAKAIWDVFTAIQWLNLGKAIIDGIGNGLTSFGGTLKTKASEIMAKVKQSLQQSATNAVNALKSAFQNAGSYITKPFQTAKSKIGELVANIKNAINFSAVAGKVRNAFNAVKTAITNPVQTAKNILSGIIKRIKGMFPFNLGRIMHLKIPHISVSGGKSPFGIGGKGKLPSFNVSWYKEGGIVDGATLIGAGEAGAEGIVPLTPFWDRLDSTLETIANSKTQTGGNVAIVINLDGKTIAQSTIDYVNNQTIALGTNPIMV